VVGKIEVFFGLVFVLGDGPSFHSRLCGSVMIGSHHSFPCEGSGGFFCLGRPRVLVFLWWRPAVVLVMGV
jgi:hypothetical protein